MAWSLHQGPAMDKWRLLGVIVLSLWIFEAGMPAEARTRPPSLKTEVLSFCIEPQMAERKDSDPCFVSFQKAFPTGIYRVCYSKPVWKSWLYAHDSPLLCGKWRGRWRPGIQRRNEPDRKTAKESSSKGPLPSFEIKEQVPSPAAPAFSFWASEIGPGWKALERLRDRSSVRLAPFDPFGISRQLLLNEKPSTGVNPVFRTAGFVHLLTATGIHLYALTDLIGFLTRHASRAAGISPGKGLWLARGISVLSWLIAWLFAGMRPGMLRPWLVVSARVGARSLGFRWQKWSPLICALSLDLAVAAIRDVLGYPGAWAPGRWIYALAVGGGLSITQAEGSPFRKHALLAIASWVYVAFAEIFMEGFVAIATPLLSLATLPMFCLVLYPGLLFSTLFDFLGLAPLALGILQAVGTVSTFAIEFLFLLTQSIDSLWLVPPAALLAGMMLAGLMPLLHLRPKSLLTVIGLLSLLIIIRLNWRPWTLNSQTPPASANRIEQLDVGQGDAALIRTTPDKGAGLVDTGGIFGLSAGGWFSIFSKRGITQLDWIALTHLDEDHAGGLAALNAIIPISCVTASSAAWASPKGIALRSQLRAIGIRTASFDGSCFPFPAFALNSGNKRKAKRKQAKTVSKNSVMTAVRVPLKRGGYYFNGGDSDKAAEVKLSHWLKTFPKEGSDERILKVSHHGSKTATNPLLLKALNPTQAWISVGLGNHYGHPAVPTLISLEEHGIPVHRTDREGVLSWGSKFSLSK